MEKYYYLKKGDIIKEGDEVDIGNWPDEKWQKANQIGSEAPDPQYPAHRTYRRLINQDKTNKKRFCKGCLKDVTLTMFCECGELSLCKSETYSEQELIEMEEKSIEYENTNPKID